MRSDDRDHSILSGGAGANTVAVQVTKRSRFQDAVSVAAAAAATCYANALRGRAALITMQKSSDRRQSEPGGIINAGAKMR